MNRSPRANEASRKKKGVNRNAAMDTIRGAAIVLMIVDHVAAVQFDTPIAIDSVRLVTRLALPLFATLFGFFLANRLRSLRLSEERVELSSNGKGNSGGLRRTIQVGLASVAANVLFVPEFEKLEVLVSLLACSLLFLLLKRYFVVLAGAVALFPYDPTLTLLDYPLTVTASLVAIGVLLQLHGFQSAIIAAIGVALVSLALVPTPPLLVLLFTIPAVCIVSLASVSPEMSVGWLAWLGRYPLTVYVAQYYVIFGIRWLISLTG